MHSYPNNITLSLQEDLFNSINYMKKSGINGVILWGSSNDVDTKKKCNLLQEYIQNVLGPVVKEIIQQAKHKSSNTETMSDNVINENIAIEIVPKIEDEIRTTTKLVDQTTQRFKAYPQENDREEPAINSESVEDKQDMDDSVKDVVIVSQGETSENVNSMINFNEGNIGDTRIDYGNMKVEFIPLEIPQIMPNMEEINRNGEVIEVPKGDIFIAIPAADEGSYPNEEEDEISLMKIRSKIYTVVGMYPRVFQFSPRQR